MALRDDCVLIELKENHENLNKVLLEIHFFPPNDLQGVGNGQHQQDVECGLFGFELNLITDVSVRFYCILSTL